MVTSQDLKDFFSETADLTKSVAADVVSIQSSYDSYRVPRKDAQALAVTAPGGTFERNRAANAASSATDQAARTGSMDFSKLFGGKSSSFVGIAALVIAALVVYKMVK